MHITSITLRFASFCLLFFISIQPITDSATEKNEPLPLLSSLEKNLNNPVYIETVLPYDLHYILVLLNHGNTTQQDREYSQSVLRVFANIFKRIPCINAYSLDALIQKFPVLLKNHMQPINAQTILRQVQLMDLEMVNRFQSTVNGLLFQSLSSQYDLFKKNPEQFLNTLSQSITTIAQEEIAIEQLRSTIVRFLETALNKVVWNYEAPEESWKNIKNLCKNLEQLIEHKILDDLSDLDDLYWSLLSRYCYFLKIHATLIPLSFYEFVEKDLEKDAPKIVSLEEQESFIESKKSYFTRTILECRAKYVAFQKGIII